MSRRKIESEFMIALRFAKALDAPARKNLIEVLLLEDGAPAVKVEARKRKEKSAPAPPELLGKAH